MTFPAGRGHRKPLRLPCPIQKRLAHSLQFPDGIFQTVHRHQNSISRLGDGSTLTVTFSTGIPDVPLPFGSDRKLLAWVFDRAINSESPMIAWESAWEYQKEMGLKRSGKNNKDLRERFHRISGLNINIERKDASGIAGKNFSIIDTYNLPAFDHGQEVQSRPAQSRLPR